MSLKHLSEYRDPDVCRKILEKIQGEALTGIRLMEVCGTHTMAIARNGIRSLLPETITLVSGPGCPVCVTAQGEIDRFIALARTDGVIVATFGDLLRVPASDSCLDRERAEGADVRVVYSAFDSLEIAKKNPDKSVVFLGVGFETTAPTVAVVILEAQEQGIKNFSVISACKLVPPALKALMENDRVNIQGFLCPGHVSVVIGGRAYLPIAEHYRIPCVVAGFEPADILQAIYLLISQINGHKHEVEIAYRRGVAFEGNARAREVMDRVFEPHDADWRGLGLIRESGLRIRDDFSGYDAEKRFNLPVRKAEEPKGCACGEILLGIKTPAECPLYKKICSPANPVGPCMVSTEGTCAAYYKYN